jgi:hypothetical protein
MPKAEADLVRLFRRLPSNERSTLLSFAEFLVQRSGLPENITPKPAPRPETESVVAAIKRLSAGYPMLDRAKMLHETAGLMSEHLLQGRPADEVIDALELVFQRHYEQQFGGEQ